MDSLPQTKNSSRARSWMREKVNLPDDLYQLKDPLNTTPEELFKEDILWMLPENYGAQLISLRWYGNYRCHVFRFGDGSKIKVARFPVGKEEKFVNLFSLLL